MNSIHTLFGYGIKLKSPRKISKIYKYKKVISNLHSIMKTYMEKNICTSNKMKACIKHFKNILLIYPKVTQLTLLVYVTSCICIQEVFKVSLH